MLDYPKLSIELPQPHLSRLPAGSELTEDCITAGQIITVWLLAIAAIAIFILVSSNSVDTVIQPTLPDPVVQSDQCFQERQLDHIVSDTYVRNVELDPLPAPEQCYVRFF